MNKFYEAVIDDNGDAQAGTVRLQVVDSSGDPVSIYADSSGTQFTDSNGDAVNYCVTDDEGMAQFYFTAASGQTLQFLYSDGSHARSPITDFANNFSSPEETQNASDFADAAEASKEAAEAAETAAGDSATEAAGYASDASDSEVAAAASATAADEHADRAETASVAALAGVTGDNEYADFATGEAATSTGDIFYVVEDGYAKVYKNGTSADADDIYYYTGPQYAADTPALLLATTRAFATGDILNTADGFSYKVVTSDEHLTTAGGIKLQVLPGPGGWYNSRAFNIVPSADNETELQAFLDATAGQRALIDAVPVVPFVNSVYRANTLAPGDNSDICVAAGVSIIGKASGGARIWQIRDNDRVRVSGYGAYIEMPSNNSSSAVFIDRSSHIVFEGFEVKGPAVAGGSESDCIYVGGDPNNDNVCEQVVIRDVVAYHSRRNILSVVGCHGFLAENCDFSETLVGGTFRRIVDFEANRYMANGQQSVKAATLRKCRIHNSDNGGVLCSWSEEITIEDCDIWDIKGFGIQASPGANIFNTDRNPRSGDKLGVISIDDATGWIEVSTSDKVIEDWGIEVGTYCNQATRDGGAWPVELTESGFYIEDVSADQLSILVSVYWGTPITSYTGTGSAGTGDFDEDPDVGALWIGVYRTDDNIKILNNRIWDTTESNISIVGAGVTIRGNILTPPSGKNGVSVENSRNVLAQANIIYGNLLANRGISVAGCPGFASNDNIITGTKRAAIALASATGARLSGDKCTNCDNTSYEGIIFVNVSKRVLVNGSVLRSNTAYQSKYGLRFHSASEYCHAANVDATTTGLNNAASVSIAGTGNTYSNCWQKDGTFKT